MVIANKYAQINNMNFLIKLYLTLKFWTTNWEFCIIFQNHTGDEINPQTSLSHKLGEFAYLKFAQY